MTHLFMQRCQCMQTRLPL